MRINHRINRGVFFSVFVALGIFLSLFVDANAKTITVENTDELIDVFDEITEDSTIKLSDTFTNNEHEVMLDSETSHNLIIDFNQVKFLADISLFHFGTGDIIIKNIRMDGTEKYPDDHDVGLKLILYDISGETLLKDSIFKNIKQNEHPILKFSGYDSKLTLDNLQFINNETMYGGGVYADVSMPDLLMKNSSFINNNSTEGYGGAISIKPYGNSFTIENTLFDNNTSTSNEHSFQAGGAISIDSPGIWEKIDIKSSIFKHNRVIGEVDENRANGGAISFANYHNGGKFTISGSTFEGNEGSGGGGALSIDEDDMIDNLITIENSTFYKNSATAKSGDEFISNGGAISIRTDDKNNPEIGKNTQTVYNSKNNSFYDNKIISKVDPISKGGAIAIDNVDGYSQFTNDLLLGNHVVSEEGIKENINYSNLFVSTNKVKNIKSLGFDNGVESKEELEDIYGKSPVTLATNNGLIKAGSSADAQIIPTLMIVPKLTNLKGEVITGIANRTGNQVVSVDQRGYKRSGKSDIGAVEIATVNYDSNGGLFHLEPFKKYTGTIYYEGTTPNEYVTVGNPGDKMTIIDGEKILKPTKTNSSFVGWSLKKTSIFPNSLYHKATKHIVTDELKLYAVWKDKKFNVIYQGNGNTKGIAPTQKAVVVDGKITMKKPGSIKKKGYKFLGWSTKATARKADPTLAPGKKVKIKAKTQFFAVWKR